METLEVFALTSDMQRATGSIPYTSLMWNRKYYEPGDFLMEVPSNVYDPSWAYIYTEERPETGIIQKVEYSDTSQVAGGVDTVILSGFFTEWELNRYTFLVEETEDEAYRIYRPTPARTQMPTMWEDADGNVYLKYEDVLGAQAGRPQYGHPDMYYDLEGNNVETSAIDVDSLTQVSLEPGKGYNAETVTYWDGSADEEPVTYYTGRYFNRSYQHYSEEGETLVVVDYKGDKSEYEIAGVGWLYGDVIYKDEDGAYRWVNGTAKSAGGTYVRAIDDWQRKVKTEGLEVIREGGSVYARAYRTVKGPWQLRTDLDINEPADNVQRIIQWAQDIWGGSILYDEPGFEGEEKIINPSLKLFGDMVFEELKTIGASARFFYSFESDTYVFEVWRGLDRTQSQAGAPEPPTPDEPEPDEPTIDELYEAVDYIESTGEQWIDTGVLASQSTRVVFTFDAIDTDSTHIMGSRTSTSSSDKFQTIHAGDGYYRDDYGSAQTSMKIAPTGTVTIDKNANVTDVNGTTLTHPTATFTGLSIYLFAGNTGGSATLPTKIRGRSCQVYADGTALTMNLMPYRRRADGVFGLLDLVNEVFYESASGVPFTGPSYEAGTYEELDYVVSTGTQYIDTGFKPSYSTRVTMDVSGVGEGPEFLFGTRNTASSGMYTAYRNSATTMRSDYMGNSVSGNISDVSARMTVDKNANVLTLKSANGETLLTLTNTAASSGQCSYPLLLLALNDAGNPILFTSAKTHGYAVYDDGTIVRDYVPRRRVSDGAVGLLDLANDTFYESAGSEPFLAPGELPSGYTRLEYIESTGSQYIDTGIYPNQDYSIRAVVSQFETTDVSTSAFGCRSSSSAKDYYLVMVNASGVYRSDYGASQYTFDGVSYPDEVEIYRVGNVTTLGDYTYTYSTQTFTCSYSLFLCATNTGGSATHKMKGRAHIYEIWDDSGNLVGQYVPAKDGGGEAGLFDLVTMAFYADASGTGFIAGPEMTQAVAVAASEPTTYALARTTAEDESNTAANPFAVFSDTWGTLYGFTASKDTSNYRNTCHVLYQFRDATDEDGNPIGPRGYVTARLKDGLPDIETYLDLRGEEPESDEQTDEAFIESLRQRGLAHLQANYAAIESLDTGTLAGNSYLEGYDLGDKVDMLVEAIGLVKEARITGVCEVHEAGSSTATLEIGEQKLTNIRKAVIV